MQQQTTVIVNQPTMSMSKGKVVTTKYGHRDWSTGLFGCCTSIGSCLKGLFCLPCTTCTIASRTGECCCMAYCVPGGTIALRARVRTLGGIEGSVCKDCLVMNLCTPCAICQMDRELDVMDFE